MKKIISVIATGVVSLTSLTGVYGAGIGVNTHIDHKYPVDTNISLAADAGFEWTRDAVSWIGVEGAKNAEKTMLDYNVNAAKKLEKEGINQLLVLGYGNNVAYDVESKFVMPTKDRVDYYEGFLDYVRFVVDSIGDYTDAYEIWNEPNFSTFNYELSKANGAEYAKLYLDCAKIIKEKDPTARVLCGAMMGDSSAARLYGEQIFDYIKSQGDVNELIDVFSIHKYSDDAEGEYADALWNWEAVFDEYGYTGDVWITENGASTYTDGALSEEAQAACLARYMVQWENYLKSSGRSGENFWYDLKDDGTDANNKEHNYGLADYDYVPKTAYNTAKLYNKLTNSKELVNYTESGDGYVAEYSDGVDKAYVLYGQSGTLNVDIAADAAYVYDINGKITEELSNPDTEKEFTMSGNPVFIECVNNSLKFTKAQFINNKNLIEIEGLAPGAKTVLIALEKDGEVAKSINAKVNSQNVFKKTVTLESDGEYVLRVSDGENEISKEIVCKTSQNKQKEIIDDAALVYDVLTKSGTVSADVSDGQDGEVIMVAVVSADKDTKDLKISDFTYIGEAYVEAGKVSKSFVLPEDVKGAYKVMLGRRDSDSGKTADFMANQWNYAYVADLNFEEKENVVTVNAAFKNFNEVPKDAMIVVAEYAQNNQLIKVSYKSETIPQNKTEAVLIPFSVEKQSDTAYFKVMVWDSFGNMFPLY